MKKLMNRLPALVIWFGGNWHWMPKYEHWADEISVAWLPIKVVVLWGT